MGKNGRAAGLRPATEKEVEVTDDVRERVYTLAVAWRQYRGTDLLPPAGIIGSYKRWRGMVARHRRGDFRVAEDELKAQLEVMRWAYEANCLIRGQEPRGQDL